MPFAAAPVPRPENEPVKSYAPGSPERAELKAALATASVDPVRVPMVLDGQEVHTEHTAPIRCPHRHDLALGTFSLGTAEHAGRAIAAALGARAAWSRMSQASRSAIFLKAAELLATTRRARVNAATMLGQSKTAYQAEIDSACELADFLRFNAYWAEHLLEAPRTPANTWNALEARPLDGFVLAVTPFNFTAIAGNLPSAPAILGNTVVWKPSPLAMRSAHEVMSLFREAGLPDGVINLVQGDAAEVVGACVDHPALGGLHFTGSTTVFRDLWQRVGSNIHRYGAYPRLVGETGGKDFVFAHTTADVGALTVALVRGAFEYQGQKCSAASRAYVPRSIWGELSERIAAEIARIRIGDVADFSNLMGAVIDRRAFDRLRAVQEEARSDARYQVIAGGTADDREGFFVHPTLVRSSDPHARLMKDEFFGPILTVFVYEDAEVDAALALCDGGSPYALTGSVFARDRAFVARAADTLRDAAGNFYVNDKPTGAVVAQQPFGGGRASGTNDKAGSPLNLLRWVSPRAVKETFVPPLEVGYPSTREP
jgi:1-pyrroline-5-carboxylate dehydrogenase